MIGNRGIVRILSLLQSLRSAAAVGHVQIEEESVCSMFLQRGGAHASDLYTKVGTNTVL